MEKFQMSLLPGDVHIKATENSIPHLLEWLKPRTVHRVPRGQELGGSEPTLDCKNNKGFKGFGSWGFLSQKAINTINV